jgi:hypothetical protein
MKKSTVDTQAHCLRQAIRHRQAQEKQELRQVILDAGVLRPGDVESYSDVLWAVVHGMVSLAITMPMFDASRIQRTMETAWQMECQGLRQH